MPVTGAAPGDPPVAALPQPVVVPRWKWRVWVHPATWIRALLTMVLIVATAIAATVAVAVVFMAADGLQAKSPVTFWATVVIAGAIGIVAVGLVGSALSRKLGRKAATVFADTIPRSEPARSFMLAELAEGGPPKDNWSAWRSRRWLETVREGSSSRAFVAGSVAERVLRYDRTDRPVEPESVGGAMGAAASSSVVTGAVLTAVTAATLGVRAILPILLGAVTVVSLVRALRRRALLAPAVAGQGWVQHGKTRWTAEDSVMVVTGLAIARVSIVGPQGVLELRLRSARGGDLEALWMRWMHPLPNHGQQAFDA